MTMHNRDKLDNVFNDKNTNLVSKMRFKSLVNRKKIFQFLCEQKKICKNIELTHKLFEPIGIKQSSVCKSMGAFATSNIEKNSLIIEYVGEKINDEYADMRNFRDGTDSDGLSYLFTFKQEYKNQRDQQSVDFDEVDAKH